MSRDLVIFDIDGTLSDCSHRRHFVESDPKDWDSFYALVSEDYISLAVTEVLLALYDRGYTIWLFTGRPERCREETVAWLEQHNIPWGSLTMRAEGDYRADTVVKREMLDRMLDVDRGRILFIMDDRTSVVRMWRETGLVCFQVAEGDF